MSCTFTYPCHLYTHFCCFYIFLVLPEAGNFLITHFDSNKKRETKSRELLIHYQVSVKWKIDICIIYIAYVHTTSYQVINRTASRYPLPNHEQLMSSDVLTGIAEYNAEARLRWWSVLSTLFMMASRSFFKPSFSLRKTPLNFGCFFRK